MRVNGLIERSGSPAILAAATFLAISAFRYMDSIDKLPTIYAGAPATIIMKENWFHLTTGN